MALLAVRLARIVVYTVTDLILRVLRSSSPLKIRRAVIAVVPVPVPHLSACERLWGKKGLCD